MCRPTHFAVTYRINPWMDPAAPYDNALAVSQWEALRQTYLDLGHTVELIDPLPGLPDMVFAANGATVVDGRVLAVQFRDAERADEAPAYAAWFRERGFAVTEPKHTNEGEGDILLAGDVLLAGTGFRTAHASHAETQEVLQRPVISLQLVDPAYYHLDTALAALDDHNVTYYPEAFSPSSRRVLRQLFPEAVLADRADAEAFGLNLVSDGRHVILNTEATGMADKVRAAGYAPVHVELTELKRGGGSVKCAVAELRP